MEREKWRERERNGERGNGERKRLSPLRSATAYFTLTGAFPLFHFGQSIVTNAIFGGIGFPNAQEVVQQIDALNNIVHESSNGTISRNH